MHSISMSHLIICMFFLDRVPADECFLRGGLVFIDEIPRNVMGKIVRNQLREHVDPSARKR